ncbi:MAG: hypothetical protein AAF548_09240 [Actinomycetota bacterium]
MRTGSELDELLAEDTGIAGWVRVCGVCGQFDMHSLLPVAAMVPQPNWRCGVCDATELIAAHVRYVAVPHPEKDAACPNSIR